MKKQFLNLGKALNKAEQKLINGGDGGEGLEGGGGSGNRCHSNSDCPGSAICCGPVGSATYCQNCPCNQKCD